MELSIEQALGNQYLMFYNAAWPAEDLHPVCTLKQSVSTVNRCLAGIGKDLGKWNVAEQDEAARLLWVNWIYQRLGVEPIRKPILVHREQGKFIVDCGDTRLMALNLLIDPGEISVVCTVPLDQAEDFDDWTPIRNNRDLLLATDFGPDAHVMIRPAVGRAIDWLEIGDQTTSHHLHSVDQRVAMMQRYLDQQPADFEFSVDWARNYINWQHYAS